jgi:hypothetical protein
MQPGELSSIGLITTLIRNVIMFRIMTSMFATFLFVLYGPVGGAQAGTIVQSVNFHFAEAGTNFDYFWGFDPSLGTLSEVDVRVSGDAGLSAISVFNTSNNPQNFNTFASFTLGTDAGPTRIMSSTRFENIPSGQIFLFGETTAGSFDLSASYRDNLRPWIGLGYLSPFYLAFYSSGGVITNLQVGSDNPNILINTSGALIGLDGTETVTYIFRAFGAVPEPSSLVMSGTAVLLLALVAWRRLLVP